MVTPFSRLLASATVDAPARVEGSQLDVEVPDDWMQGRSVFGGLQLALALRAMRALVPSVPLRTLQATFFAPVRQGPVRIRASVMRRGKNATHVEARLVDAETALALAIGVFGASRESQVKVTPSPPTLEIGEGIEVAHVPGVTPTFTQHFDVKWLRGLPPFTSDRERQHVLSVGMRDEGAASEGHVVALPDFVPPIALSHLSQPAMGSTLTWMLEMLADRVDHLPLSGWRVDAELMSARDGYTSQSVLLSAPDGSPVALARQCMLVFG